MAMQMFSARVQIGLYAKDAPQGSEIYGHSPNPAGCVSVTVFSYMGQRYAVMYLYILRDSKPSPFRHVTVPGNNAQNIVRGSGS